MSNLDDYFKVMSGVARQRQMTGNPAAGLTAQNAALTNMGYQTLAEAKQNKGLALQERQVATGERAQAETSRFNQQQAGMYNKALDQQKVMGWANLGAGLLGAGATYKMQSDRTDALAKAFGNRSEAPAALAPQQAYSYNAPATYTPFAANQGYNLDAASYNAPADLSFYTSPVAQPYWGFLDTVFVTDMGLSL